MLVTDSQTLWKLVPNWIGRPFSFDVETSGLDFAHARLLGLALTFNDDESYYISLAHTVPKGMGVAIDGSLGDEVAYPLITFLTEGEFAAPLRALFSQHDVEMIAHHAKFDSHFLQRAGLSIDGRLFDTMLAAQYLDENRKIGLKELAPAELGMDLASYQSLGAYPGFGKNEILGVPLEDAAEYAMRDTLATFRLWKKFRVALAEAVFKNADGTFVLEDAFYNLAMPMSIVLQQMEAKGVSIDIPRVQELQVKYEEQMSIAEDAIWRAGIQMLLDRYRPDNIPTGYLRMLTPEEASSIQDDETIDVRGLRLPTFLPTPRSKPRTYDFKPGSDLHLKELLYEHMGLEPPEQLALKRNANGDVGVDKDTIAAMTYYLGDQAPSVLKDVLLYRKAQKLLSTYLGRFIADADPSDHYCIRTNFNQAKVETGRLSSSGPNLQNIPSRGDAGRELRSLFIARPGHKIIAADLGQAELRILAHYSGDETLLQAFANNEDLHIRTGAAFAGMTYEDLMEQYKAGDHKARELRQLGKTGNFALTYGMGPQKFRLRLLLDNGVDISDDQAREWIDGYNKMYAGAYDWKQKVHAFARNKKYVSTIGNRVRHVPEAASPIWKIAGHAQREAANAIIQGSVMDILSDAMPKIQVAIRPLGGYQLLQVHDEIVAEAPEETAQLCADIMVRLMLDLINPKLRCPLIAEAHIGDSWSEAKG